MPNNFDDILKFCTPARWWGEKWREGLYLGNGKMGANVYGGASEEKILFNEATLSWRGRTTVVPDVSDRIEETKRKIDDGDFLGAQNVIPSALKQKNFRPQAAYPLPLCELNMLFDQNDVTGNFERKLDMAKGEVTVSYNVGDTRYKRCSFVSRADNLFAYRITKQGNGTVSVRLSFRLMHRVNSHTYEGLCDIPEGTSVKYDRQNMCFAARNDDNGTDFGAVAKLHILGGSVRAEEDYVDVLHAQSVLILVKVFASGSREREWSNLKLQLDSCKDGYEKLFKAHAALHSKLYGTASLQLGKAENVNVENLLLQVDSGVLPPQLVARMYRFARYLTVSGIPEEGFMGPCGLWNGCYKPYRAFVSAGGELEMSLLHRLQGNMMGGFERSFEYFWNNLGDYRNNAQRIFGCRGIVVPVVAAPYTGRLGSTDIFAIHFSGCAAWIANLYYKYAKYSSNTKFLKNRLIPFMKEVAQFYEDFISHTDSGLEMSPSALPMRIADGWGITDRPFVAKNSALELALAKDLLTNLVEACKANNVKGRLAVWQKLLEGFPDKQIASDGTFREFVNSLISADYTGISNGTLYPVYFGEEISFLSDDETKNHYILTADKKRGNPAQQNSFNMTVLAAVYARLGESGKANESLTNAVRGCVMNNLVFVDKDWRGMGVCGSGVWTPVQLNVNMTFAHAVQQMLMYSCGNTLSVFPALPEAWGSASFDGFLTENGVEAAAFFDSYKKTLRVTLECKKDTDIHIYLPDFIKKLTKSSLPFKPQGNNFELTVPAGKKVELLYKTK